MVGVVVAGVGVVVVAAADVVVAAVGGGAVALAAATAWPARQLPALGDNECSGRPGYNPLHRPRRSAAWAKSCCIGTVAHSVSTLSAVAQVWSLTQFYSVGFSQSKSVIFANTQ